MGAYTLPDLSYGHAAPEKRLAFNLSRHVRHSVFWQNLSGDRGGRPDRELADAIAVP